MENKKRKIAIIAGSRGEYGYIRPIIREIEKDPDLDYGLIATNMHVLDSFGSSVDEIKKDKIKVFGEIHNTFDGYTHLTMAKSLSVFMLQLPEILKQMETDMIIVSGDRGEQLMASIVGAYMYIPVAHIQAGEVSGNIDGVTRHAITKFAHLHFAANQDATDRILKMGEEPQRVYTVGAPQLDELTQGFVTPSEKIYQKFSLSKEKPSILFAFHSVTEELDYLEKHLDEVLPALSQFPHQTVMILNNSDAGSKIVRRKIIEYKRPQMKIYKNVPRQDYAGLMNVVDVIVGNSSSGILEAPTFKLPAVNIGNREKGRLQGINVINADYNRDDIFQAINKALSPEFKANMQHCVNPYGDGRSAERIVKILKEAIINDKLLVKKLTY